MYLVLKFEVFEGQIKVIGNDPSNFIFAFDFFAVDSLDDIMVLSETQLGTFKHSYPSCYLEFKLQSLVPYFRIVFSDDHYFMFLFKERS